MTLRSRLAWTYGIAVTLAVVLFAIVSIAAIDRALRTSLDDRLATAAAAVATLPSVHDGVVKMDSEDRDQMQELLAGVMEGAVFDGDGNVVASSETTIPPQISAAAKALPKSNRQFGIRLGDHNVRVAITPLEREEHSMGAVAVWQGSDFIQEFDRYAAIAMAVAALAIGGVVVILSSTLARRALSPLERFSTLATEIEAHDLSRRVGAQGTDELGRVGSAFDRMLDRLEAAFVRQRRFTADASHELRAPLAVIRAEADVALAKDRSVQEYRNALETIASEVDRIDALVDGLLAAARADSARMKFERVDLGALALLAVQRFTPAANARGITIATSIGDAHADGDAAALERAIAAILHNALDFAAAQVRFEVEASESAAHLRVIDDGPGFSNEGLAHATERFWRADPARARGGTGLGLSIADAIVRAHHGDLTIANVTPHGASVTITLCSL